MFYNAVSFLREYHYSFLLDSETFEHEDGNKLINGFSRPKSGSNKQLNNSYLLRNNDADGNNNVTKQWHNWLKVEK